MMFIVNLFYVFDLGNYSYLDQRIDVSSFKLLENPLIALAMIWETYPVFWIICGLISTFWIFWKGIKFAFQFLNDSQQVIRFWHKTLSFISLAQSYYSQYGGLLDSIVCFGVMLSLAMILSLLPLHLILFFILMKLEHFLLTIMIKNLSAIIMIRFLMSLELMNQIKTN